MPELPEVETVRRVLLPRLQGKTIRRVRIWNEQVLGSPPETFAARLTGQTVADFLRRGKFLRLAFAGGDALTLHLRMTGCLLLEEESSPPSKHTHLGFLLSDGKELRYEDVRRFGKFWFLPEGEKDPSGMERLGIEPFDPALTAAFLAQKTAKSKKPVKEALLDQRLVAGIGNIYSDEILFAAGIRPDKACNLLGEEEFSRLAAAIPERLAYFTEKNALTFEEYAKSGGKEYRNTPYLQVYGKSGAPCPRCGGTLAHMRIAGRSAVFCPHCQH